MAKSDAQADPLRIQMGAAESEALGIDLLSKITSARDGMKKLISKMRNLRRFYENDLPPKNEPWEGCSNVNVPLTIDAVDPYHARINGTIMGVTPWVLVEAPEGVDKTLAASMETFIYNVESKVMNLREVMDSVHLDALLSPSAIGKVTWCEEYRTRRERRPKKDDMTGEPVCDVQTGQPVVEPVEVQEVRYRGPKPELVDLNNFVIYPLTAKDVDSVVLIGDRYRLTPDQVRKRIKSGQFEKEPAERLLASPDNELTDAGGHRDEQQDDVDGIAATDFEELWFWEVIAGYDANGDGLKEDCVFVLEEKSGIIVRKTKFPYDHGRRYYIRWRAFINPNRFYGRYIPAILEHMQREINTLHNQRTDATHIALSKPFKTRRGSGIDNLEIFPGSVTKMDSMDDLQEILINPNLPGIEIEETDRNYAERATGSTDMAQGRMTDATQTAAYTNNAMSLGNIRFEDVISRLQESQIEMAHQVVGLCYQFMTDEEIVRYSENPEFNRDMLLIPWTYVPHGNSGTANRMQQRSEALALYDKLSTNPLVMNDPKRFYALTRDLLTAFGRKSPDAYIGTEQDLEAQVQQAQLAAQQMQEAQLGGIPGAGGVGGVASPMGAGSAMGVQPDSGTSMPSF